MSANVNTSQSDTKQSLDTSVLFQPVKIKSLELKNRIVMAPMTRNMAPDGIPNQSNADYYRRRAEGGVGLILSEGTVIDRPGSRNEPAIPFLFGESALSGWKGVVDEVHTAGGHMGPQIWHVGSVPGMSEWKPDVDVESPSGLIGPDTPRGIAMSESDIADAITAYAQAAVNAKSVGFDLLELHAAHGYLIDQFFWQATNIRADSWSGNSLPERSRFAIEVIKAVRKAVGPDFPIFLRLSQWKQQDYTAKLASTPQEMEAWLSPMAEAGVDVFHCSQRRFWEPEFADIDGAQGLNFAGWAKKLTGKTTVSVGSVGLSGEFLAAFGGESSESRGLENLVQRLEREEFDLIAVGRALLSDPLWVEKVRRGDNDKLMGFDPSDLGKLI